MIANRLCARAQIRKSGVTKSQHFIMVTLLPLLI